jgi:omega-6 fatty acid desaturase (delta-12 desaturase)
MTRDQVFVPKTRSQRGYPPEHEQKAETAFEKADEILEDAPIWVLSNLLLQQVRFVLLLMGRIPSHTHVIAAAVRVAHVSVYQCIRAEVWQAHEPSAVICFIGLNASFLITVCSDFEPSSPVFDPRHAGQILWSDFGVLLTVSALVYASRTFGFGEVVKCWPVSLTFCPFLADGPSRLLYPLPLGQPLACLHHLSPAHGPPLASLFVSSIPKL